MVGLAALAAAATALLVATRGSGDEPPAAVPLDDCRGLLPEASLDCYTRSFSSLVADRDDPRPQVEAIEAEIRRKGGFALSNCHGVMHTVGRTYAVDRELALSDLKDVLPRSNDPGCSAGFAHGLVTGVAPRLDVREPREAADVCAGAGTRYQRYSCVHGLGHAFMRIHGDRLQPALDLCRSLGEPAPDCAQGAYHDYWFAVVGADAATLPAGAVTEPRVLCGAQPAEFVRPCWYRAYVDNRPAGIVPDSPEHFEVLCDGLAGLQRAGCITAVSVIGPGDPAEQLRLCASLPAAADAASCVRGTKVQNLLRSTTAEWLALIGRCDLFRGPPRIACYRWLGKTLAVVTNGAFAETGCPQLPDPDAHRACAAGARRLNDALATFS